MNKLRTLFAEDIEVASLLESVISSSSQGIFVIDREGRYILINPAAGEITAQAREYGRKLIKVGESLIEVSDLVEQKIRDLGGDIAFPAQISINEIAAHYCAVPDDETVFKDGDLVKLDIGAHVEGYVGDTACTIDLGNNPELVKASEEALQNAIKTVHTGVTLGEIGRVVQETIQSFGFSPIKNLSGHAVGKFKVHGKPSIPNFDTGDKTELEEGEVIAIEPFATDGEGSIYESGSAEIFMLTGKKPVRNMFTRQILKEVEKYNGLPFTTRWLTQKFSLPKVRFALKELKNLEILHDFPPLPDRAKGMVSQAEHTIIVGDKAEVITL